MHDKLRLPAKRGERKHALWGIISHMYMTRKTNAAYSESESYATNAVDAVVFFVRDGSWPAGLLSLFIIS